MAKEAMENFSKSLRERIDSFDTQQKQVLLDELVEKVEVSEHEGGIVAQVHFRFDQ
jgi:hypothetical protein